MIGKNECVTILNEVLDNNHKVTANEWSDSTKFKTIVNPNVYRKNMCFNIVVWNGWGFNVCIYIYMYMNWKSHPQPLRYKQASSWNMLKAMLNPIQVGVVLKCVESDVRPNTNKQTVAFLLCIGFYCFRFWTWFQYCDLHLLADGLDFLMFFLLW